MGWHRTIANVEAADEVTRNPVLKNGASLNMGA